MNKPAFRVVGKLGFHRHQSLAVPADHGFQEIDHIKGVKALIRQHGPGGVTKSETAHQHVQPVSFQRGHTLLGQCDFGRGEQARHQMFVPEQDFEDIVRSEGGADVILDMVGGDYVQKNISAARIGGRIVNIAYMQGPQVQLNLMPLMLKRLILTGTTLRARPNAEKQRIRDAVLSDFWPAIISGGIRPVIDTVYAFDQAEDAQAHMAKGGHIGKILLSRQQS